VPCALKRYRKVDKYNMFLAMQGTLLRLTQKKLQILKVYGSKIKYFTFIKPTDETVATINHANILQVWDASTGEFVNISNIH